MEKILDEFNNMPEEKRQSIGAALFLGVYFIAIVAMVFVR